MHKKFFDRRPNPKREFFEVGILEVINAIRNTAPNFGKIKYEEIYYQDLRKIEYKAGNVYEGEIKNNLGNGHGTFTWANGNQYVGEFKDGKMHGQGTWTCADGGEYAGEYNDGEKQGFGTLILPNGNQYVGDWKNSRMHGHGT